MEGLHAAYMIREEMKWGGNLPNVIKNAPAMTHHRRRERTLLGSEMDHPMLIPSKVAPGC